jgi:hypothetical protein
MLNKIEAIFDNFERFIVKYFNKFCIITSILIFVYLLIRAYFVPFLHDEIMTFWFYVDTGEYIPFKYNIDVNAANNHLINTFICRFFYNYFGYSPFILRISNLIFIPFYCYFSYKIAKSLNSKFLALILFLSFITIHPIVEFLALCRGYGISFAMLLGSFWYANSYNKSNKILHLLFSIIAALIALSANLSLMLIFISILFYFTLKIIINRERLFLKLLIIITFGLLPLIILTKYSFLLQKGGALYYGSQDGFWTLTVTSLLKSLVNTNKEINHLVLYILSLIFIVGFSRFIFKNLSVKILNSNCFFYGFLLFSNVVGLVLLNTLFKVNYPDDRAAFYFYYLFIIAFIFLIDEIQSQNFKFRTIKIITLIFFIFPFNFLYGLNLTHVSVYKEDRIPYHFYDKLKEKSESCVMPVVGSHFGRTLVTAFHNYLDNGNLSKNYDSHYPSLIPDFQIIKHDDLDFFKFNYFIIDYDKITGYYLLERKYKLNAEMILSKGNIVLNRNFNDEFFNFIEINNIDSLISFPLKVEFDLKISTDFKPFEAWLVATTFDKSGKTTSYEYVPLNWLKNNWKNQHIKTTLLLTNLPVQSERLLVYIWNIKKSNFAIEEGKIRIFKVNEN